MKEENVRNLIFDCQNGSFRLWHTASDRKFGVLESKNLQQCQKSKTTFLHTERTG